MKDEFDDVTPDMFEGTTKKTVSRPDISARLKDIQATVDRGTPINKSDTAFLEKYGRGSDKVEKVEKAPARPFTRGTGGAGGAGGETGFGIQKMNKNLNRTYKKGGTVSSASSRADGCVTKGRTKGRFV